MPTYASFTGGPPARDLTPGKRYRVTDVYDSFFMIRDDADREHLCLWRGCAHLSGGNWTRHDEPDAKDPEPGDVSAPRYTPGERQAIAERPRASDAPPLLGDMTDAEIGALVRAHRNGVVIQCGDGDGVWSDVDDPSWCLGVAYRIKPEPVRETVPLYCRPAEPHLRPMKVGTIDKIDDVFQPGTFKLL